MKRATFATTLVYLNKLQWPGDVTVKTTCNRLHIHVNLYIIAYVSNMTHIICGYILHGNYSYLISFLEHLNALYEILFYISSLNFFHRIYSVVFYCWATAIRATVYQQIINIYWFLLKSITLRGVISLLTPYSEVKCSVAKK